MSGPRRHVRMDDPPTTWCGDCGTARNPYRYGECPRCYVENGDGYWLGCDLCGYDWITESHPSDAECPRCDAGSAGIAQVLTP